MIFKDSHGFPVERNGDGGDSTVRAGILMLTNQHLYGIDISAYEVKDGHFTRHPIQVPWNNPKNFSRDQTLPFIAGLNRQGLHAPVNRFFWERAKHFFFAQNTERDHVGSTKYPWPHEFVDLDGKYTKRNFDFADPLFFNHIGALVIAGRVWQFYLLVPFFLLVHLLMLLFHSLTNDFEENQMIAECSVYKTLWLYRRVHKRWAEVSLKYWSDREEAEYHALLREFINERT